MLLSPVWLFATPWTVACQAPLSMEFSGKNMGMGCHFLLQGIFPNPGLLHYRQIFFYHLSHIYLPFIDWSIDWLPSMWPHGYIILQIITQCYFILLLKIAEKQFWYFFKNFGIFSKKPAIIFSNIFSPFSFIEGTICLLKMKVKSLSHVWLFSTPWTVAYQAPPSTGCSRQEYWSGFPFPSPT